MKRDFLKTLDLSDEVIDKIMAEHGNGINGHKAKQTELETQLNELKAQVSERDKQLDELKKSVGDSESLKEQINKLQEDNKKASQDYEARIKQMGIDNAVTVALTNAKAKNSKAVRALLDLSNAELDGEVIKGLDKQIEKLKESDAYLFDGEVKPEIKGVKPAEGGKPATKDVNKMTYTELKSFMDDGGTI